MASCYSCPCAPTLAGKKKKKADPTSNPLYESSAAPAAVSAVRLMARRARVLTQFQNCCCCCHRHTTNHSCWCTWAQTCSPACDGLACDGLIAWHHCVPAPQQVSAALEARLAALEQKVAAGDHMSRYGDNIRMQDFAARLSKLEASVGALGRQGIAVFYGVSHTMMLNAMLHVGDFSWQAVAS